MQAQYLWAERYAEKTHTNEYAPIREMAEWVPEKLGLVITKAIRRSPDERYLTCEDMQVDLLDIEDSTLARAAAVMPVPAPGSTETTSAATPESIDIVVQRTRERKRWMVVGGAAAAAVLLAGVLLVWSFGGSSGDVAAPDAAMGGSPVADAFVASASDAPSPEVPPPADFVPAGPDAEGPPVAVGPADAGAGLVEAVPEAKTVLIVVAGAPAGATIKVGEYVAESDPPKVRVPYSEELLTVTVEAKGFEKFEEVILPTSDRVVNVRMRPIRRPPPRRDGGTGGTGTSFPEFPEGP
jgi:hypothetical protein